MILLKSFNNDFILISFIYREDKEKWIRAKYETKQFLASLQNKEITVGKVITLI